MPFCPRRSRTAPREVYATAIATGGRTRAWQASALAMRELPADLLAVVDRHRPRGGWPIGLQLRVHLHGALTGLDAVEGPEVRRED